MTDESPYSDITYYRLSVKEFQGVVKIYNIIYVDESTTDWKTYYYQNDQNLIIEFKNLVPKNSTIYLFDLSGKLLAQETVNQPQTKINTSFFSGKYLGFTQNTEMVIDSTILKSLLSFLSKAFAENI